MPENEDFWNPYRMVVGPQRIEREQPAQHARFSGISGHITGTIKAVTPIFVGSAVRGQFFKTMGKYCIPATSFKGMLRSLVEIVGKGCDITASNGGCTSHHQLCAACRLFGMSVPGATNILFQGKVFIGDLPMLGIWDETKQAWTQPRPSSMEVLLSSPRPRHRPFYGLSRGEPAKRKFYHHQAKQWNNIVSRQGQMRMISSLYPLPEDSEFSLEIRMENLSAAELALLLYCLELERDIAMTIYDQGQSKTLRGDLLHKIGAGKPLGLGSIEVNISPRREDFYLPAQRYTRFAGETVCLSAEQWQRIQQEKNEYHLGGKYDSRSLQEVRAMLLFPDEDDRCYRYPSDKWFSTKGSVGLKPFFEEFVE